MAQQWAIFKVGTADVIPGQSDAWAYVLKGRVSKDEKPSEFEQLTMQRSCLLVLEVRTHPSQPIVESHQRHQAMPCTVFARGQHLSLPMQALQGSGDLPWIHSIT